MNILNEPTQGLIVPTKICYTYQFNNRTFSTQNTKISARSLAISYICFQVRIVKKKKREKKAILSTTTENLVTPAPPTPNKGSIREIATGEITLPITDDHLEGPYLLKTRELPGAPPPGPPAGALPLHPASGPTAGPWTPPVWGARCATRTDFSAHPFFANPGSATVHIPPCSSKSLAPRGVDPGGAGEQSPPPPQWKYWGGGGGQTYRFAPPPQ